MREERPRATEQYASAALGLVLLTLTEGRAFNSSNHCVLTEVTACPNVQAGKVAVTVVVPATVAQRPCWVQLPIPVNL